ncbi:hypothetical protein [Pseudorhodoferax sp. Leaf265]|uniref:hypothetical protein n=1 Tax=Pseudorhodoferax sp. Leaf265 TaxID=1736315 RepID=UPI0006FBDBF4|nr:hypothetical protein [Pseudorhodoferax sp. Leaf265]KQP19950.1 hypothetical protein ASF45_22915 [Pseudorhodoferax sp. Leaf265]
MSSKNCKTCGTHKPLTDFYRHPAGYHFAACKACCIAARSARYRAGPEHDKAQANARLRKDPRVRMAAAARKRDREKGYASDIRAAHITIPKVCPILGIPLAAQAGKLGPGSPSIDHIDPKRGAVWGNWRVISARANQMKKNHTAESLAEFIERVEHPERFPGRRKVIMRDTVSLEEYRAVLRYLSAPREWTAT